MGSDEPDVSEGRPSDNIFENNQILNTLIGCKIKEGDNNVFTGETFRQFAGDVGYCHVCEQLVWFALVPRRYATPILLNVAVTVLCQ